MTTKEKDTRMPSWKASAIYDTQYTQKYEYGFFFYAFYLLFCGFFRGFSKSAVENIVNHMLTRPSLFPERDYLVLLQG